MEKALLILFGGRSMPNMLTVIHQKPKLIVAIVSRDQQRSLPLLESAIKELSQYIGHEPELDTTHVVDAFNLDDVYHQCLSAVRDEKRSFDWIFNITAATTIMSIGAYEAAKELSNQSKKLRCWYINTLHKSVVPLIGEGTNATLFDISVDRYAAVYNCKLAAGDLEGHFQDDWISFSKLLATHPHYIDLLKEVLKKVDPKPSKKRGSVTHSINAPSTDVIVLLEEAYRVGLLENLQKSTNNISIKLSYIQANFLNGSWLEAYVCNEAKELGLFFHCQWNIRVVDPKNPNDKDPKNELDVALIYHAQLLVAECKTNDDAFRSETLYKLDSVTGLLGGRFVSKMIVTSSAVPDHDKNQKKAFEDISARAEERGIVIVTREQLGNIKEIITKQAKHPKQARI